MQKIEQLRENLVDILMDCNGDGAGADDIVKYLKKEYPSLFQPPASQPTEGVELTEEQQSKFVDLLVEGLPEYGIDASEWSFKYGDCCYGGAVEFIARAIKGYTQPDELPETEGVEAMAEGILKKHVDKDEVRRYSPEETKQAFILAMLEMYQAGQQAASPVQQDNGKNDGDYEFLYWTTDDLSDRKMKVKYISANSIEEACNKFLEIPPAGLRRVDYEVGFKGGYIDISDFNGFENYI